MYVLSNKMRNYGAACIVYPHILEMIWNILQTDYYVLPSSVHEVIITPCHKSITCEELDEMIQDINATQIDAEEVLSGHAYLYEHPPAGCASAPTVRQEGGRHDEMQILPQKFIHAALAATLIFVTLLWGGTDWRKRKMQIVLRKRQKRLYFMRKLC